MTLGEWLILLLLLLPALLLGSSTAQGANIALRAIDLESSKERLFVIRVENGLKAGDLDG